MKHFVQGHNECFPTCLGIYLEKEPKQIIKEILGVKKVSETTWNEWVGYAGPTNNLLKVRKRLEQYYLPRTIPWLTVDSFSISYQEFVIRYANGSPFWPNELPKTKGFITMNFWHPDMMFGAVPPRHIIAFEGEMIFDPGQYAPMPYRTYKNMIADRTFPDTLYCPEGRFTL